MAAPAAKSDPEDDEREHVIRPIERQGWTHLPRGERPKWVVNETPDRIRQHSGPAFEWDTVHGDDAVFKVASSVHGTGVHVFSMPNAEYYETTPEAGTCPHCQDYLERDPADPYLTCPDCGWQYRPLGERLKRVVRVLTRRGP